MTELVFKGANDQALTNSLLVAEKFGKEHKHVLDSIRELVKGCAENSADPMFEETTYVNVQNKQNYPMFVMNRDGFTLLAMSFTGSKAMQFKLEYINAFNQMERALKNQYAIPQTYADALMLAANQAKQIEEQQKTIKTNAEEIVALSDTITKMQPKVSYYDKILASTATLTVTQVAQDYGMSAKAFNVLLRNFGIQHKVNGRWILYAKYLQQGYVHSHSVDIVRHDGRHEMKNNTEWLQKGRLFLYEELKKHNILPLIEQNQQ